MIDSIDRKILMILQGNARTSNAQIARELGLAASGIHERIRKLEKKGVITGYHARLNPCHIGLGVTAFSFIRTEDRPGEVSTAELLAAIPEVEELHHIAGDDCFLVKLRCGCNEDLGKLLRDRFTAISTVQSSKTSVVLETIKEGSPLPLGEEKCE